MQKAFTRPAPKSAGARMRYLVKQLKGTKAVAQLLRISQRTVERYVKDQIKTPRPDLAARLEREVKARWQPQIRAKAREKAAITGGIVIDTRARLGDRADRVDGPGPHPAPDRRSAPRYAARPFDAQEQGVTEQRLQELAAEALKEVYFQDGGRRAGSLEEVRFTDIEHLEFDLQQPHPNSQRAPTSWSELAR